MRLPDDITQGLRELTGHVDTLTKSLTQLARFQQLKQQVMASAYGYTINQKTVNAEHRTTRNTVMTKEILLSGDPSTSGPYAFTVGRFTIQFANFPSTGILEIVNPFWTYGASDTITLTALGSGTPAYLGIYVFGEESSNFQGVIE